MVRGRVLQLGYFTGVTFTVYKHFITFVALMATLFSSKSQCQQIEKIIFKELLSNNYIFLASVTYRSLFFRKMFPYIHLHFLAQKCGLQ